MGFTKIFWFKLSQKKVGASKKDIFFLKISKKKIFSFKMDKKFIKCLESWKKYGYDFFYMFGIMKKTTEIFTKIWENNNSSQFLFIIWRLGPLYPRFHMELLPQIPHRGLRTHDPGWKTIDWNSSQLVFVHY